MSDCIIVNHDAVSEIQDIGTLADKTAAMVSKWFPRKTSWT